MASEISVKIEGLEAIRENMRNLGRSAFTENEVVAALRAGGNVIRKEAILKAPIAARPHKLGRSTTQIVEPGNLRQNLRVVKRRPNGHYATVSVMVRSKAFYWRFLEFGTRFIRARPFLRPAFEQTKQAALDAVVARLKLRIEKEIRKLRA